MKALSIPGKGIQYNRLWDFLVFLLLTLFSILNGSTTVFYVIYFFWWSELIRVIVDGIYYGINKKAVPDERVKGSFSSSVMLLVIYFVFIVVFFGFMLNWSNIELMQTNMNVLFFQNWFFNANLLFLIMQRLWLHRSQKSPNVRFNPFTPNMIVIHLSIILGGVLMFFVVKKFPETFTPDNLWGSVIIISPFILLKAAVGVFSPAKLKKD